MCCRILHKIPETHKIWHPSEQSTYLFPSIGGCNISSGCAKILEIPEGSGGNLWGLILENPEGRKGHTANPFGGGGMDIFCNHTMGILFLF